MAIDPQLGKKIAEALENDDLGLVQKELQEAELIVLQQLEEDATDGGRGRCKCRSRGNG